MWAFLNVSKGSAEIAEWPGAERTMKNLAFLLGLVLNASLYFMDIVC